MNHCAPLVFLVIFAACAAMCTVKPTLHPQSSNYAPTFNACADPPDVIAAMTDALKIMYQQSMFQAVRFPRPPMRSPFRGHEANIDGLPRDISLEASTCEEKRNISQNTRVLSEMSTCPWEVAVSYDPNRIPNTLAEAKCICSECIKDCRRGDLQCRPWFGICKPVMTSLTVFRRHCNITSGLYEYRAGLEHVAAGCTCIRPSYKRLGDDDDDDSAEYDDEEEVDTNTFENDER